MAKDQKKENPIPEEEQDLNGPAPEQEAEAGTAETPGEGGDAIQEEKPQKDQGQLLAEAADKYLRLAAEYDNYRKRTASLPCSEG